MKRHFLRKIRLRTGASRFVMILLAVLLQAAFLWTLMFLLNQRFALVQSVSSLVSVLLFFAIVNRDQPAVYKLPWLIFFLLFPVVGLLAYLTFGNLTVKKKYLRRHAPGLSPTEEEVLEGKAALAALGQECPHGAGQATYLSGMTGFPLSRRTKTKFLPTGEAFWDALLADLRQAQRYILLEYFIIAEGSMWEEILSLLREKRAAGVRVCLLYDDVGSMPRLPRKYAKRLRKEGIEAYAFNPFRPIVSVSHNVRDHRKIAVVDGLVGYVGGANLADEYINRVRPLGRWRDTALRLEGEAVCHLVSIFLQTYNMMRKDPLSPEELAPLSAEWEEGVGFVLPYDAGPKPIYPEHIGENAFLNVISQATERLYITTPYLIVDSNLRDALRNAAMRGVDVRIILPQNPDKRLIHVLTRSNYKLLLPAGVKLYEYKDGFIHSKTFLCDGRIGIVGTVNLDYRSLVHHLECAVWMYRTEAIGQMEEDFLSLLTEECRPITEREARLSPWDRLVKTLLYLFAPLF